MVGETMGRKTKGKVTNPHMAGYAKHCRGVFRAALVSDLLFCMPLGALIGAVVLLVNHLGTSRIDRLAAAFWGGMLDLNLFVFAVLLTAWFFYLMIGLPMSLTSEVYDFKGPMPAGQSTVRDPSEENIGCWLAAGVYGPALLTWLLSSITDDRSAHWLRKSPHVTFGISVLCAMAVFLFRQISWARQCFVVGTHLASAALDLRARSVIRNQRILPILAALLICIVALFAKRADTARLAVIFIASFVVFLVYCLADLLAVIRMAANVLSAEATRVAADPSAEQAAS